ncbi:RNA-directed DNA polymerase, eukaryota [Tanacetum coccineum]
MLWSYLASLITSWNGESLIMGDFNEVRSIEERWGSVFNVQGANAFNSFISSSLRFIILLGLPGFDELVKNSWNSFVLDDSNEMIRFKKKLQMLKKVIRTWTMDHKRQQVKERAQVFGMIFRLVILLKLSFPWLYALEENIDLSIANKIHAPITSSFRRPVHGYLDLKGVWIFRVKDVRNLLDESFLPKVEVPTRWIKSIPIKVNVFAWKLFLDRLPTRSNLARRNVTVPSLACSLCGIWVLSSFDSYMAANLGSIYPFLGSKSKEVLKARDAKDALDCVLDCTVKDLDSEHSTVTYTSVYEDDSDMGSPGVEGPIFEVPPSPDYVPGPEEPEQAPPSPIYIPFIPEPVYPEFLPGDDEEDPEVDQPYMLTGGDDDDPHDARSEET